MMKEYKFEPSSQMIDVEEGKTVELVVKGTRVAFRWVKGRIQVGQGSHSGGSRVAFR